MIFIFEHLYKLKKTYVSTWHLLYLWEIDTCSLTAHQGENWNFRANFQKKKVKILKLWNYLNFNYVDILFILGCIKFAIQHFSWLYGRQTD